MTIGAKIRYIRALRNMTQAELGKAVHLSGDRIRQYENNVRTPKKDKLEEIAHALDVDVSALSDINITSTVDIMHILFELEDELHLQIEKRGNRYSLTFGNESPSEKEINNFLDSWYNVQQKAIPQQNDSEDIIVEKRTTYDLWKKRFPLDLEEQEAASQAVINQLYLPIKQDLAHSHVPVEYFSTIIEHLVSMLKSDVEINFSIRSVAIGKMNGIISFKDSQLISLNEPAKVQFAEFLCICDDLKKMGMQVELHTHTVDNETFSDYYFRNNQIGTFTSFLNEVKERLAAGTLDDRQFKVEYEDILRYFNIPIKDEIR